MKPALTRISSSHFFRLLIACGLLISTSSCLTQSRSGLFNSEPDVTRFVHDGHPQVNINTASADELERLPGIGPGLAARIVEHRERYGRFRRAEHIVMVRGLSHKRFMAMQAFVTVE